MKLDPGMHIDLHLVFFGKTGVTTAAASDGAVVLRPPITACPAVQKRCTTGSRHAPWFRRHGVAFGFKRH
jgi:hypothetical protein